VARLSLETGIAPQHLIELDPAMFKAMMDGLKDRAKEMNNASKRKGRG
jgi:hypothetical protein